MSRNGEPDWDGMHYEYYQLEDAEFSLGCAADSLRDSMTGYEPESPESHMNLVEQIEDMIHDITDRMNILCESLAKEPPEFEGNGGE